MFIYSYVCAWTCVQFYRLVSVWSHFNATWLFCIFFQWIFVMQSSLYPTKSSPLCFSLSIVAWSSPLSTFRTAPHNSSPADPTLVHGQHTHTHTHTHIHTHIYIYIYMCVCVCVCVLILKKWTLCLVSSLYFWFVFQGVCKPFSPSFFPFLLILPMVSMTLVHE